MDPIEDLIHTIYQRELEVKAGQSGSFTMTVDASSLLHPAKSQPIPAFMLTPPPSKVHIASIQIVQSIQTRLNASNVLSLTGTATAQGPQGYGVGVIAWQHALSPDQMVTLTTLCGARNKVVVEVAQALTKTLQGVVSVGYGGEGVETGVKVVKQFSEELVGMADVSLEQAVECNLRAEYTTENSKTCGEVFVGQDVGGRVSHLHTLNKDRGYKIKGEVVASASDLSVVTVLGKTLTSFSKLNLNVEWGLKGVTLKTKYQRGSATFVLPVLLSHNPFDLPAVLLGYGAMAVACVVEWCWTRTTAGQAYQKKKEEEAKRRAFVNEHEKLAAVSQQAMMKGYADRIRKQEEAKKGLVILRGVYGSAASVGVPEKVAKLEGAMEVTTALQFMVKESKLRLYAGSKKEYMGFWKPEGEERVRLWVRYQYGEKVYEVEVEDGEPLYLPAFRATEVGEAKSVN